MRLAGCIAVIMEWCDILFSTTRCGLIPAARVQWGMGLGLRPWDTVACLKQACGTLPRLFVQGHKLRKGICTVPHFEGVNRSATTDVRIYNPPLVEQVAPFGGT